MMPHSFIAGLHHLIPCPKVITYFVSSIDGMEEGVEVDQVESRPLSDDEMLLIGAGGAVRGRTFHVWSEKILGLIDSNTPKEGDKITDENNDSWIVASFKLELDDTRYRLLCKKAR